MVRQRREAQVEAAVDLYPLPKKRLVTRRRRALAPDKRAEFDSRVLAGEDIATLSREFSFEGWYARRRAARVLSAASNRAVPSAGACARGSRIEVLHLVEDVGPIRAAIIILGSRPRVLGDGTYMYRGLRIGPKQLVRIANEFLTETGSDLIPYPGLTPYRYR